MKRFLLPLGLVAALAVPAAAQAAPGPSDADFRAAKQACTALRGDTEAEREAFRAQFGANAFGKCVSAAARDEHGERHLARALAVEQCENVPREDGAFGRCVATQASRNKARFDRQDAEARERRHNAAAKCDAERTAIGDQAFAAKYPPESGQGRSAFGRCVSQAARAQSDS
jgi:hypothetical protein